MRTSPGQVPEGSATRLKEALSMKSSIDAVIAASVSSCAISFALLL